jgi:hypothetical protein
MREELLEYYERELTYLRQMGGEFARKYPKVAGRLLLDPDRCDDPHVNRLLEGFALLAARVHRRLDDDFPEISESLVTDHPSGLSPSHSFDDYCGVPGGPGPGKEDSGLAHSKRDAAGYQGHRRGAAVPLSHRLRRGDLALYGGGRGVAPAGADAAAAARLHGSSSGGRGSTAASLPSGCDLFRPSSFAPALSSGRGCERGVFAV